MKQHEYILRYYLPIRPHFDATLTEQRFEELLDFCRRTATNAVMLYVALDPNWYYMADSLTEATEAKEQMLPYVRRLREAGISYQLNFQNLVGSIGGGADFSQKFRWEHSVDHQGRNTKGCACPLGKRFRAQAEARLRLWAETKPDVIWLDDDLRLHNHGTPLWAKKEGDAPYRDYYCFCDEHIRRFNEKNGSFYTRETLIAELTSHGSPSPLRSAYLSFLGDTMTETATWIRQTVHAVSPHTRLAIMTSRPDAHAAEGRSWHQFLSALCDKETPILRPHFGPYQEKDPRDFVQCYAYLAQTVRQLHADGVSRAIFCPEIENTRFTVWSKSSAATAMQLSLSSFMGCAETTLSLYDLDGGALSDEPLYEKMLIAQRDGLNRLTSLDLGDLSEEGVIIPISPTSGASYRMEPNDLYEAMGGSNRYFDTYLLRMGIPCRYLAPHQIKDGVVALDGFTAGFLSDEELTVLFKGALLLEGDAARTLLARGFGDQIGIQAMTQQKTVTNAEHLMDDVTAETFTSRVPSRTPIDCWYAVEPRTGARVFSEFLDPLGNRFPALLFYKNSEGGRVLTYPARRDFGSGFYTHRRVRLWKDLLTMLDPTLPRLDCHSYALCVVKKGNNGERYVWVANLSADPTEEMVIDGTPVNCRLALYETAVFQKSGKTLQRIP